MSVYVYLNAYEYGKDRKVLGKSGRDKNGEISSISQSHDDNLTNIFKLISGA